ncbi:hypothetical protein ACIQI7_32615 [Kitasatospora sp. NPDC092039]|uniref:hypothetical protein n=1 Tax=Kitasatospora sp. NPDC092039 TaxID=3364086 RepID=UPI0038126C6F
MGKGKRLRAQPRVPAQRRIVVVDALEVGQFGGVMTLRCGRADGEPLLLLVPGEAARDVVQKLEVAALDAEEEYWGAISYVLRDVEPTPAATSAAMEKWLLEQDWNRVVRAVGEHPCFVVTYVGHLGLAVSPPFAARPSLAVIDPGQAKRLAGSLRSAAVQAMDEARRSPASAYDRLCGAAQFLLRQPWPRPEPVVTPEEADAWAAGQYQGFLRRSPFIRPAENDLIVDPE